MESHEAEDSALKLQVVALDVTVPAHVWAYA
jgi:hypothetical protein